MIKNKYSGFTLIEVMISMLIFSTGMLGVAFQMSQGIKNTLDTEIHSSVMQISLQAIEPLKKSESLKKSTMQILTSFRNELITLNSNGSSVAAPFSSNTNQKNFSVVIDKATDRLNTDLLTNPISTWVPPFTVVLKITYDKLNSTKKYFYATHVLVP